VYGDKYDYSKVDYKNNYTNVIIICHRHGEFNQRPNNHLNGSGCLACGMTNGHIKLLDDTKSFIEKAQIIHGNKYFYDNVNYVNVKTKISIICPKHGEFKQTPNKHLSGDGCPICKESKGERNIRLWLEFNNVNYIPQHKFNDCKNIRPLPFDFYLPDYNICIEYQGEQHYRPIKRFGGINKFDKTVQHDKIKKEYCESNNIILKVIKYTDDILTNLLNINTINILKFSPEPSSFKFTIFNDK
jgi:hypothetical protein